MNLIERLESLGSEVADARLTSDISTLTSKALNSAPKPYLDAIDHFKGDIEFSDFVVYKPTTPNPRTTSKGTNALDYILGLTSDYPSGGVFEFIDRYAGRLPAVIMPFGVAPGGNLLCFDTSSPFKDIYFWDHELEGTGRELFKVADSFEDFVESLRFDDEDDELPSQEVEVKLNF